MKNVMFSLNLIFLFLHNPTHTPLILFIWTVWNFAGFMLILFSSETIILTYRK